MLSNKTRGDQRSILRELLENRNEEPPMEKVNLAQKFGLFHDHWNPRIAGELNDSYIKLVKVQGEFVWHQHEADDEFFLVMKGKLQIKLRDGEVVLGPGEFFVVPKGVEHCPVAEEETHVVLLEPKTVLNTGNVQNERTVTDVERI
jgi:mannose-6-phosphate isomerase-like protein (cupin superfamily)